MSEMRLQRAMARAGVASRRKAEELIEAGSVMIDGKVATLGSKVDPDRQRISVKGRKIQQLPNRWILLHKPLGVVTTADDEQGRKTVLELIPNNKGLTYVGRLDVMTTGLLLLTTDGEAVHRLTHPKYRIPRRYSVLVHGVATEVLTEAVKKSVVVDGRPVVPLSVRVKAGRDGRSLIDISLAEGRNAIVRKWVAELGGKVERLARLSYGPIRLGDLEAGEWRPLQPDEVRALYKAIDMLVP